MTKILGYDFFTTTDGVELAYQVHGDQEKSPLILVSPRQIQVQNLKGLISQQLHGFTGSSAVWSRNIAAFRSKYRVIVPDLRGHGRSGKRADGHDHYVARLAQDLKELMDHLGIAIEDHETDPRTPSCIASSLGCAIIWFVLTELCRRSVFLLRYF